MRGLMLCMRRWRNADEKWHECTMEMNWWCFGEEVSQIVISLTPSDVELFLANSISDPVKLHINGFRFLGSNCIGGEPDSALVVGCRLGVTETIENSTERGTFLCIVVGSAIPGLRAVPDLVPIHPILPPTVHIHL